MWVTEVESCDVDNDREECHRVEECLACGRRFRYTVVARAVICAGCSVGQAVGELSELVLSCHQLSVVL